MCVVAGVAIAGGAVASAYASKKSGDAQAAAANRAADISKESSDYAADIQKQIYDQQRADQADWQTIGRGALNQLSGGNINNGLSQNYLRPFGMADFKQDPGYQFRLDQGLKAIQGSAAARGGLLSGNALRGISRYGQDYASGEYQNAYNRYNQDQANSFNRLAAVSGVGQAANNALGQAGQNYAGQVGNITMTNAENMGNAQLAAGQARASAYTGMAKAVSGGVNNYLYGNNWKY